MTAQWIVERTTDAHFPFRIRIEQGGKALLCVRAQAAWPGAGKQIFCLRESETDPGEILEPHEHVPIAHIARLGRKLSVTLDRAQRKRCEFLKLEKPRKDGSGSYEQIFLRTEAAVRQHRSARYAELPRTGTLDIVIDAMERYPWRFPGANITRRKLPVGDYALLHDEQFGAIVERKSRENLLADFGQLKGLQQQLAELAAYPHAALVVEAQYADFSNPRYIGPWTAAYLQRVLAELATLFPAVQFVYAGNRKLANLWTQRYLAACASDLAHPAPDGLREASANYHADAANGGLDTRIRLAALNELPDGFRAALLREHFPDTAPTRITRILDQLRSEGRLTTTGHGPGTHWHHTGTRRSREQG